MVKCGEMPYTKIGGSPLLGNNYGLPVLKSALLPIRLLKRVRYKSPKTSYTRHKIPVAGPYSQYLSYNLPTKFVLEFYTHSLE